MTDNIVKLHEDVAFSLVDESINIDVGRVIDGFPREHAKELVMIAQMDDGTFYMSSTHSAHKVALSLMHAQTVIGGTVPPHWEGDDDDAV